MHPIQTAITLSLLPSNPRLPFVLGPDLKEGFRLAAKFGFDAVEIFPPSPESLDVPQLQKLCQEYDLRVSTIGTGGGALRQGLTLTDASRDIRQQAIRYIQAIIEIAGELDAAAIVGSMQGQAGDREPAEIRKWLGSALAELGDHAAKCSQVLLYEPLNRYETDLINRLQDAKTLLEDCGVQNVRILADLFHMNMEESDLHAALRGIADHLGHVHFVDSNRWTAGQGHTDLAAIVATLRSLPFQGYLAVEAFPLPDPVTAARNAASTFSRLLGPASASA